MAALSGRLQVYRGSVPTVGGPNVSHHPTLCFGNALGNFDPKLSNLVFRAWSLLYVIRHVLYPLSPKTKLFLSPLRQTYRPSPELFLYPERPLLFQHWTN